MAQINETLRMVGTHTSDSTAESSLSQSVKLHHPVLFESASPKAVPRTLLPDIPAAVLVITLPAFSQESALHQLMTRGGEVLTSPGGCAPITVNL